jgi:hypothetical protein
MNLLLVLLSYIGLFAKTCLLLLIHLKVFKKHRDQSIALQGLYVIRLIHGIQAFA